jgi:hypothetical protein
VKLCKAVFVVTNEQGERYSKYVLPDGRVVYRHHPSSLVAYGQRAGS